MAGEQLVEMMKAAALKSIEGAKAADVLFGEVTGIGPLKIKIDGRFELSGDFLIVPRNLTDYTVDFTVGHFTESEDAHTHAIHDTFSGGGSSSPTPHLHAYKGRKQAVVNNALKMGDKVALLRAAGGQKFYILDRVAR
jgi:hypothetical protein